MGVQPLICPFCSGRRRSAIRHGVLERRSPSSADGRVEPAWRVLPYCDHHFATTNHDVPAPFPVIGTVSDPQKRPPLLGA
jgi:hypothetical protein